MSLHLNVYILQNYVVALTWTVLFCTNGGSNGGIGRSGVSPLYSFIISSMLVYDPKTIARTPNISITMFFQITQLPGPNPMSQYTTNSINTGMLNPRNPKQREPIKAKNGPIVGTATASNTVKKNKINVT